MHLLVLDSVQTLKVAMPQNGLLILTLDVCPALEYFTGPVVSFESTSYTYHCPSPLFIECNVSLLEPI